MKKHLKRLIDCLFCHSGRIQKNGQLPTGGQRFRCGDCRKHFTVGGARGTYDESFRQQVVDEYCHANNDARSVAEKFSLSTSTIIARAKKHKSQCTQCVH